jgi:hypothetical protein
MACEGSIDSTDVTQADPLKSAANVNATATALPASATTGTEVDIQLTLTTRKSILGDVSLTVYSPAGTSAYRASWTAQQLTPGTPLVLTEPIVVEGTDPLGTYRVGVVVKRTGGGTLFSSSNLAHFMVTSGPVADAGSPPTPVDAGSLPPPPPPPQDAGTSGVDVSVCNSPIYTNSANDFAWYAPGENTTKINNDTWHTSEAGPQTMYICSLSSFYVISNQPNLASDLGSVKSYPSVCDCSFNQAMNTYTTMTATFGESVAHQGEWDAAFDIFTSRSEIMIDNDVNNHASGADQGGTPVTIDGVAYHVVYVNSGFIVFMMDNYVQSGSINFLHMFSWLVSKGWASWSDTLSMFAYGVEISWTESSPGVTGPQRFDITAWSLTAN